MHWGDNDDGGFMNSSIAEEPTKLTDTVGIGGDDKNKSIAAVSVCLITKFTRPNEGLVLHNKKIYHLNLVAFVRETLEVSSTKIQVLVDDFTAGGPLEVTHIIGDTGTPGDENEFAMFNDNNQASMDEDAPRTLQSIVVGDYIRCIGVVKFNQDKPNFIAYNLKIVEDPNEIPTHNLEVIRDSMLYEKQSKGINPMSSGGAIQQPLATNNAAMGGGGGEMNNLLSTREKHILKFLKDKKAVNLHIDEIAANFKAFSRHDIRESINVLCSEGLAWPGDSEDQFCVGD